MFSSIAHKIVPRPRFVHVPDCDRILVIRALNCARLCRSHTKLCPNFGCSRARLCPISFAPCPFPNLAGTLGEFWLVGTTSVVIHDLLGQDIKIISNLSYFPFVLYFEMDIRPAVRWLEST